MYGAEAPVTKKYVPFEPARINNGGQGGAGPVRVNRLIGSATTTIGMGGVLKAGGGTTSDIVSTNVSSQEHMSSTFDAVQFKNATKDTNTYRGSINRKSGQPMELGAIDHSKAVQKLAKIKEKTKH